MADKFTKACIMTRPTKEDDKVIEKFLAKGIKKKPNMIWHIYKTDILSLKENYIYT